MTMKNVVKLPALEVDEEGKVLFAEVALRINYIQCLRIKILGMLGPKCNFENGIADDYLTTFSFECPKNKQEKINEWLNLEFENFK